MRTACTRGWLGRAKTVWPRRIGKRVLHAHGTIDQNWSWCEQSRSAPPTNGSASDSKKACAYSQYLRQGSKPLSVMRFIPAAQLLVLLQLFFSKPSLYFFLLPLLPLCEFLLLSKFFGLLWSANEKNVTNQHQARCTGTCMSIAKRSRQTFSCRACTRLVTSFRFSMSSSSRSVAVPRRGRLAPILSSS